MVGKILEKSLEILEKKKKNLSPLFRKPILKKKKNAPSIFTCNFLFVDKLIGMR